MLGILQNILYVAHHSMHCTNCMRNPTMLFVLLDHSRKWCENCIYILCHFCGNWSVRTKRHLFTALILTELDSPYPKICEERLIVLFYDNIMLLNGIIPFHGEWCFFFLFCGGWGWGVTKYVNFTWSMPGTVYMLCTIVCTNCMQKLSWLLPFSGPRQKMM